MSPFGGEVGLDRPRRALPGKVVGWLEYHFSVSCHEPKLELSTVDAGRRGGGRNNPPPSRNNARRPSKSQCLPAVWARFPKVAAAHAKRLPIICWSLAADLLTHTAGTVLPSFALSAKKAQGVFRRV